MKLRITEAKLKEMDELTPLGKTDLGDLWDMRQDWVEMKKEVDRLREENELLKDKSDQAIKIMMSATSDNERLRQDIERLKEDMQYYANRSIYEFGITDDPFDNSYPDVLNDKGERARQAIQRIKGESEQVEANG